MEKRLWEEISEHRYKISDLPKFYINDLRWIKEIVKGINKTIEERKRENRGDGRRYLFI